MRSFLMRCRIAYVSLAAGGSLLVLEGCDPNARETVLSGVEAATTGLFSTFIAAFFQSLISQDETATTITAVLHALPIA